MSSSSLTCDPKLLRYKLILSYDGTRFKGFQRQTSGGDDDNNTNNNGSKNSSSVKSSHFKRRRFENDGQYTKTPLTVQEFVEDALESLTGLSRTVIRLRFAGRTDGGVHARGQVCAISLPENLSSSRLGKEEAENDEKGENAWHIQKSINSRLPVDVSVDQVSLCENQDFDPRKDVKLKRYSYTIKYRRKVFQKNDPAGEQQPIPISSSGPHTIRHSLDPTTIWVCPWSLDDTCLIDLCQKLSGEHDFSVFVHKHSRQDKDNNLNLQKLQYNVKTETVEDAPAILAELIFESKGFRRSMIRNIVGFLVDVCRGVVDKSIVNELWTGNDDVASKIHSAPACGLCLDHVFY